MLGPQLVDRLKGQFSAISYILIFLVVGKTIILRLKLVLAIVQRGG